MQTKRTFKVRFHLAKGVNFMKWQIKNELTGTVIFLDPSEVSLRLRNCFLRNQIGTAKKINEGANKSVCAWVECDSYELETKTTIKLGYKLAYNPKETPNWSLDNIESFWHGENIDGKTFKEVLTSNRSLYSV